MNTVLTWQPEPTLLTGLITLASEQQQTVEEILTTAVTQYLAIHLPERHSATADSLIGLFSGPANLASHSEDILHQEITPYSGWTWKEK